MLNRGIHTIGTMKSNRLHQAKELALPKNPRRTERGTMRQYFNNNNIYFITWMDTKVVNLYIFSTIQSRNQTIKRKNKTGEIISIRSPTIIELYNTNMGGSDLFDQKIQYYMPKIRTKSWKPRVILHFLYIAVINSHILYREYNGLQRGDFAFELIEYIKMLITELISIFPAGIQQQTIMRRDRDLLIRDPFRIMGVHTSLHKPTSTNINGETVRKETRRICACCKVKRSTYICQQCNVALCISSDPENNCIWKFHSHNLE